MRDHKKIFEFALFLGIGILAFLIYIPALDGGFLNWDDEVYVSKNPAMRSLDLDFIVWALTSTQVANWHPLTWISWAIDYKIFGPGPYGFHLTNVILHAINSALVFMLSSRLASMAYGRQTNGNGLDWRALLVGAVSSLLFALHPLHVESVAWVSERKDLLYSLFYITGLMTYLRYASVEKARFIFYIATLAAFALSIMGKAMAVTFPVALLILDYYPLNRLSFSRAGLKVLAEKLPFAALAATSALMAVVAQDRGGALVETVPFVIRLLVAARGYVFYLLKLVFPADLAPFYPYPSPADVRICNPEYIGAIAVLVLITAFCVVFRKKRLYMAVWAFFVMSLLPVVGLIQVGTQAAADRYMYLPSLGLFIIAGALTVLAVERLYTRRAILVAAAALAGLTFAALGAVTVRQQAVWKDTLTFWNHELSIYPNCVRCNLMKGVNLREIGRYEEAMESFMTALNLAPGHVRTYSEIGITYGKRGRFDESIGWLSKAIEIDPSLDIAYNNRGYSYFMAGDYGKAIDDFNRAVVLNPSNGGAYYNLAMAYTKTGKAELAEASFKKAAAEGIVSNTLTE